MFHSLEVCQHNSAFCPFFAVSNASRTLMMDIHSCSWHEPFLQYFGADMRLLPKIHSNSEVYGLVQIGPLKDVPISGSLGDQQAAMLGGFWSTASLS